MFLLLSMLLLLLHFFFFTKPSNIKCVFYDTVFLVSSLLFCLWCTVIAWLVDWIFNVLHALMTKLDFMRSILFKHIKRGFQYQFRSFYQSILLVRSSLDLILSEFIFMFQKILYIHETLRSIVIYNWMVCWKNWAGSFLTCRSFLCLDVLLELFYNVLTLLQTVIFVIANFQEICRTLL